MTISQARLGVVAGLAVAIVRASGVAVERVVPGPAPQEVSAVPRVQEVVAAGGTDRRRPLSTAPCSFRSDGAKVSRHRCRRFYEV
jgi:hypothetical protein